MICCNVCRNFCSHTHITTQAPVKLLFLPPGEVPQSPRPPAHHSSMLNDPISPGSLTFSPSYLQMSFQLPPKLLLSLEKDPEHQITISRFMLSANLLLLSHFIPQQAGMEGVAALPHHCCQQILGACLKPQRLPLD